jgi:hypothetical protein
MAVHGILRRSAARVSRLRVKSIVDSFDVDFGVDEWHGHNVFLRDGERVFRTYCSWTRPRPRPLAWPHWR